METVAVVAFALFVGLARALGTRRHRRATSTVARALSGVPHRREARFARYPSGWFGR